MDARLLLPFEINSIKFITGPEIGLWRKSGPVEAYGMEFFGLTQTFSDISFSTNFLSIIPANTLTVFGGVGLGIDIISHSVSMKEFVEFEGKETEVKFGVRLIGGTDFKISNNMLLFAAIRYDLVSNFNQFKLYGGFRYKF